MPSLTTHIFLALSLLHLTAQTQPLSSPCDSSFSCQDLHGLGSLNTTCTLTSPLQFPNQSCVSISGSGNFQIAPQTKLSCETKGCSISIAMSSNITIGSNSSVSAGSIALNAANIILNQGSVLNTTGQGGPAPDQTSGTPPCCAKSGGGHGGRGANCVESNRTDWGGDVYGWSSLALPWSFGSNGGDGGNGEDGGNGGGRVLIKADNLLEVDGEVRADGGEGGVEGGGGSGGSVIVQALKL